MKQKNFEKMMKFSLVETGDFVFWNSMGKDEMLLVLEGNVVSQGLCHYDKTKVKFVLLNMESFCKRVFFASLDEVIWPTIKLRKMGK